MGFSRGGTRHPLAAREDLSSEASVGLAVALEELVPVRQSNPKIAIFDYVVTNNNAIGMCHRRMMKALAGEYDFTLFSCEFDNPVGDRIEWIKVPTIRRPLAALLLSFQAITTVYYLLRGVGKPGAYTWVHGVETNFLFANVIHAQFCHQWFLTKHWKRCGVSGPGVPGVLRGALRWLDHYLHALWEPLVYRRAKRIVVASQGLKRELSELYPYTRDKISVVSNPVDRETMARPVDFDRRAMRARCGAGDGEILLTFVALGQFERKGLPPLLEALASLQDLPLKLVMVGGQPDLVRQYEQRAAKLGIADRVRFVGMQKDTRPYLWAGDCFVLPSLYEVFPMVALEAAAAGCLLMSSHLNGVEEFMVDGENGIEITCEADGIARGLERLAGMSPENRARMTRNAAECVRQYDTERFVEGWRQVYASPVAEETAN